MTPQELRSRAAVTDQLCRRFPDVAREQVQGLVAEAFDAFAGARVRDFVEVLAERQVADRIRAGVTAAPLATTADEAAISA